MQNHEKDMFYEDWVRLCKVTERCRGSMHEPDEQDISAIVTGYIFDNAMGDNPRNNNAELTVGIKTYLPDGDYSVEWFNLASLIALARKAVI